jgi:nucleoside-diphosphate-sugar epimerase
MAKVLITGGCGHIGSSLIRLILGFTDVELTVVDNMYTQRYNSLFGILGTDMEFIDSSFEKLTTYYLSTFDVVIHLAALTDAAASMANRESYLVFNHALAKHLFERCAEAGTKVIFPSTTSVYGTATDVVTEETEPNPQSPYAESKLNAEKELQELLPNDHIILRLGTIHGYSPGMRFHTAINKFCYQAAIGYPLTIWKDNYETKRPYLYVGDACDIIKHCIMEPEVIDGRLHNIVGNNATTREVVELIESTVGEVQKNIVDTPIINQYSYTVRSTLNKIPFKKAYYSTMTSINTGIWETFKHLGVTK